MAEEEARKRSEELKHAEQEATDAEIRLLQAQTELASVRLKVEIAENKVQDIQDQYRFKENVKNMDPIIKIYCEKSKTIWFKRKNDCHDRINNLNTHIIYTENGEQKIIPGFNIEGPHFSELACRSMNLAKLITSENKLSEKFIEPVVSVVCKKRKRAWCKKNSSCQKLIENPDKYIIYTENGKQKILRGYDYEGPDLIQEELSESELLKYYELKKAQLTHVNLVNNTEFYFYLRGHIRNSFKTDRLKNFLKLLKLHFPNIKFILQTWNHEQCKQSESWRKIVENDTIITKSSIENYFDNKDISEKCLIIDENTIELVGSTEGRIGTGFCPKKGWKNMWYGIYNGIKHLDNQLINNVIVSFRYDFFNLDGHGEISEGKIIQFIEDNLNSTEISFYKDREKGCDNLYMGKCKEMMFLIKNFHYKLDSILRNNRNIFHQEFLVHIVANVINNNNKVKKRKQNKLVNRWHSNVIGNPSNKERANPYKPGHLFQSGNVLLYS